jgi:nitroreductase
MTVSTVSVPTVLDPTAVDAVDGLLRTTRSFRRRLDVDRPVDLEVVRACIDTAVFAPSSENQQNWRWLIIEDDELRARIAGYYLQAWTIHRSSGAGSARRRARRGDGGGQRNAESVSWLADNLHRVPVFVIPCALGRPPRPGTWGNRDNADLDHLANVIFYGSLLPAVWSFQLALRSRGLGSVLTCMHLPFEAQVGSLLGIPTSVTQLCLVPVAHITGSGVRPAPRAATDALVAVDRWSAEL